ncbi:PQQ-dependent sugar dehydrogenase [Bacillus sp. ISL-47]|uniref:PQQ-dependent sugar dehydrogenase n=1 Tax=Bacillus sp. ISL-47 TaxID=2819130 RepID=UPI001BE99421|nr:PQQ-dependent sugar dehydrogenase [Bacillus sp. ISL-47]MBT2687334.1 PQQ-dependent sugar dehydrogenase [Bacillus sp. ISL-47]MBT2706596.1 PQQ-dependent sugar dehydrogenase [Pseudomonas sp. ISL-84]
MKRVLGTGLLAFAFIAGCSNAGENEAKDQAGEQEVSLPANAEPEILADELDIPWSIAKTDETFYMSERQGSIVKVEGSKKERQKVQLEKKLSTAAEAGLLGFVLTPDFSNSNKAFAYYTYENSTGQFNRIVILMLQDGIWKEEKILLDKIPSGQFHHGGRLEIGPDGKLYATAGDAAANPEIAQDLNSLGGKILRMNLDGTIPADNPFPDSYVYSYGHRNPQGLAWASDGVLYESEHGPSANDEINKIIAGKNYGWPEIKGTEKKAGMESPLFTSGDNETWAPSGMDYHDGKLYTAALRGSAVLEFDLEAKKVRKLVSNLGRIRDVFIEGNNLYFISNNTDGRGNPLEKDDKLYRISLTDI